MPSIHDRKDLFKPFTTQLSMNLKLKRIAFLCVLSSSPAIAQTTWFVDASGTAPGTGTVSDPYTRVDYAVAQTATVSGDIVFVQPGIYQDEVIDLLGKDLHLFSRGATLRNSPSTGGTIAPPSLVTFSNGESAACILEGFTLIGAGGNTTTTSVGGFGPVGSGVFISGASPVIRDCTFGKDNAWGWTSTVGGGIYVNNELLPGQDVRIEDCVFQGLHARNAGGAIYMQDAIVTVEDSPIENGFAPAGAGIFAIDAELHLVGVDFTGNDTGEPLDRGCHGYVANGTLSMDTCTSRDAVSGAWYGRNSQLSVQNSLFENNFSPTGSACFGLSNCQASFEGCQFLGNGSDQGGFGGAISASFSGLLQVHDCVFDSNFSAGGGAIDVSTSTGPLEVGDCTFTDNTAESRIDGGHGGGAIAAAVPVILERCTFTGNVATSTTHLSSVYGGALSLGGTSHIADSQFFQNAARALGPNLDFGNFASGGAVAASTPVTLMRCLLQENAVENAAQNIGGALYGPIDAIHCTLRGNTSGAGGGASAMVWGSLTNCIVWEALAPALGGTVSVNHSIVPGGTPGTAVLDLDPLFWGADDSHLMPGSPAIDAGDPNLALDPDGSVADLGVYPFDGTHCGPNCAGEIGTITCVAQPNSTGAASTLTALGSSVVVEDLLILHSSGLPTHVFGFYLASQGPGITPGLGGGQGVLCLGPPALLRFNEQILFSGAGGTMTQREGLAQFPMNTVVQAGESWHFQLWHRDTDGVGMPTSNTSPAVRVDF